MGVRKWSALSACEALQSGLKTRSLSWRENECPDENMYMPTIDGDSGNIYPHVAGRRHIGPLLQYRSCIAIASPPSIQKWWTMSDRGNTVGHRSRRVTAISSTGSKYRSDAVVSHGGDRGSVRFSSDGASVSPLWHLAQGEMVRFFSTIHDDALPGQGSLLDRCRNWFWRGRFCRRRRLLWT